MKRCRATRKCRRGDAGWMRQLGDAGWMQQQGDAGWKLQQKDAGWMRQWKAVEIRVGNLQQWKLGSCGTNSVDESGSQKRI